MICIDMKRFPAIVYLLCVATTCSALDTTTLSQSLKVGDNIFSSGGIIELGILSQGESKNAYSPTRGCVMVKPLICKKGNGFYKFSCIKVLDTDSSLFDDSMRLQECKTVCLKNCSCMAFTMLDIKGDGKKCLQWYGDFFDIQQLSRGDQDLYVRVSFSESDQPKGKDGNKLLMILTVLVALVLLVQFLAFCIWKKRKKILLMRLEGSPESKFVEFNSKSHKEDVEKPLSSLSILVDATTDTTVSHDLAISNELRKVEVGPVFRAGKAKLGDKITALQQVVSPFGKTDTASVLWEAIEHIRFLQEQVSVLSNADLKIGASIRQEKCDNTKDSEGQKQDLRSRGLCLVPVSSIQEPTIAFRNPECYIWRNLR